MDNHNQLITNPKYMGSFSRIEDVPELIYERPEIIKIRAKIKDLFNNESPPFITLINGTSGSGKTLSVSFSLLEEIKKNQNINWVWVDGNTFKTTTTLYKKICSSLGGHIGNRVTVADLILVIVEEMNKKNKQTIIVIDEVEKIYYNSREVPKYMFLQSLIRMDVKPRPAFFFITNEFNFVKNLRPEIKGGMDLIVFESYNAYDLHQILLRRAKFCLAPWSYDANDLGKIAKVVYQNPHVGNHANARNAIEILSTAANMAVQKGCKISEVLDKAIEFSRLEDYKVLLRKYNQNMQLLIKTLATMWLGQKKEAQGILKKDNPILEYDNIKNRFHETLKKEGLGGSSLRSYEVYMSILVKDRIISNFCKGKYYFIEDAENIITAFQNVDLLV